MTEMEEATQPAPKEPEPYLMIRLLELTNFKSYANTIKIGPFDRHMTSVVGPNGSGKSNVIDAMLFVFGFKANKCARASTPFASASAPARSHPRSPSPRHKKPPPRRRNCLPAAHPLPFYFIPDAQDAPGQGVRPDPLVGDVPGPPVRARRRPLPEGPRPAERRLRGRSRLRVYRHPRGAQGQHLQVLDQLAGHQPEGRRQGVELQGGDHLLTAARHRPRPQPLPHPPGRGRADRHDEAQGGKRTLVPAPSPLPPQHTFPTHPSLPSSPPPPPNTALAPRGRPPRVPRGHHRLEQTGRSDRRGAEGDGGAQRDARDEAQRAQGVAGAAVVVRGPPQRGGALPGDRAAAPREEVGLLPEERRDGRRLREGGRGEARGARGAPEGRAGEVGEEEGAARQAREGLQGDEEGPRQVRRAAGGVAQGVPEGQWQRHHHHPPPRQRLSSLPPL